MAGKRQKTTDAIRILDKRYFRSAKAKQLLEEERAKDEVARALHKLRTDAGLTQGQLAKRVGTTTSVISRLEDAEYRGHSLKMLQRIGAAVGKRVQVRFVDAGKKAKVA
jgi:ribosome-binding protein aMBF1 (putative translation factor)